MIMNEAQETIRYKILLNPINRKMIRDAAEELTETKINKRLEHNGEPLLGTIWRLIGNNTNLTLEEKVSLQIKMYWDALDEYKELLA